MLIDGIGLKRDWGAGAVFMVDLRGLILNIIRVYKPPRRILHGLIYLALDGDGGIDWSLGYLGPYSEVVEGVVRELLDSGIIRICPGDRLSLDNCPGDSLDSSRIVSLASKTFIIRETAKFMLRGY